MFGMDPKLHMQRLLVGCSNCVRNPWVSQACALELGVFVMSHSFG